MKGYRESLRRILAILMSVMLIAGNSGYAAIADEPASGFDDPDAFRDGEMFAGSMSGPDTYASEGDMPGTDTGIFEGGMSESDPDAFPGDEAAPESELQPGEMEWPRGGGQTGSRDGLITEEPGDTDFLFEEDGVIIPGEPDAGEGFFPFEEIAEPLSETGQEEAAQQLSEAEEELAEELSEALSEAETEEAAEQLSEAEPEAAEQLPEAAGELAEQPPQTLTEDSTEWRGTVVAANNVTIKSRVRVSGNVTLVLQAGKTLTVPEGICVTTGNSLTIDGSGTLNAGSDDPEAHASFCAGIGGGWAIYRDEPGRLLKTVDADCGTIIINGGTINAKGSKVYKHSYNDNWEGGFAAGIGGGAAFETRVVGGSGGSITINGGTVNAWGYDGGAGIGGGGIDRDQRYSSGGSGTITIKGGKVQAYAVPNQTYTYLYGAGIGGGKYGSADQIIIQGDADVTAIGYGSGAGIGSGASGFSPDIMIKEHASVTAESQDGGAGIGSGMISSSGSITIQDNAGVTALSRLWGAGIGGGHNCHAGTITIRGNALVNATSRYGGAGIGGGGFNPASTEESGGSVTIEGGTVTATGTDGTDYGYGAGIGSGWMGSIVTVTINGGSVNATGGERAAGIGGGYQREGKVEINGGTVTAVAGKYGAAIGGGLGADGGEITIKGGTVTAEAKASSESDTASRGAAIGGGCVQNKGTLAYPEYVGGSGGKISIEGGTVTTVNDYSSAAIGGAALADGGEITISGNAKVTATGGSSAAAIGGGFEGGSGTIKIRGGEVTAIARLYGPGIGIGEDGSGGTVEISGGKVTAKGSLQSAAIGGGNNSDGGTIIISGGEVKAEGGVEGAGIGGGSGCSGGTIEISGGKVDASTHAYSPTGAAGIGGGYQGSGGTIIISGGTVNAVSGLKAAGIGGGSKGAGGSIEISGGSVNARNGDYEYILEGMGIGCGYEGTPGTVRVSGGTVRAYGYNGGIAGDTTLSYTDSTRSGMSLKTNLFSGTVVIADGHAFTDGSKAFSGTYSGSRQTEIVNRILVPWDGLEVRIAEGMQGWIRVSRRYVSEGDTVSVTVNRGSNWGLKKLTFTPEGGDPQEIETDGGRGSFSMPGKSVTLSIEGSYYLADPQNPADISVEGTETALAVGWTVNVNPSCDLALNGMKLSASIADDSRRYITMGGGTGLNVTYRDRNNVETGSQTVSWDNLEHTPSSFSYGLCKYDPADSGLQETFTFDTSINIEPVTLSPRPVTVKINFSVLDADNTVKATTTISCRLVNLSDAYLYRNIRFADCSNGSVSASACGAVCEKAKIGETVTVTAVPEEGYVLTGLRYTKEGESDPVLLDYTIDEQYGSSASFSMPGEHITVHAAFTQRSVSTMYLTGTGSRQAVPAAQLPVDQDTIPTGWYYVSRDAAEIDSRITVSGDVHLILCDEAELKVHGGINVAGNNRLTIYAQSSGDSMGALTVDRVGQYKAGIGGGCTDSRTPAGERGGYITINGGRITASGGESAAGIGGGGAKDVPSRHNPGVIISTAGGQNSGGTIIINGGMVNAIGGSDAAGIGGGRYASGGTITITGGVVAAKAGVTAAAIGGGEGKPDIRTGSGGTITISGGAVRSENSGGGVGIGGGAYSSAGDITISGGRVLVEGTLGVGFEGSGGRLTMSLTGDYDCIWAEEYGADVFDNKTVEVRVADGAALKSLNNGAVFTGEISDPFNSISQHTLVRPDSRIHSIKVITNMEDCMLDAPSGACEGETVMLTARTITGWILKSLSCTPEGGESVAVTGKSFTMPDADVTVYATFAEVYTVVFNANGGGGDMEPYVSEASAAYTLPEAAAITAPEGKTFEAWSVKIGNAEPVIRKPGESIQVTADTTATAMWTHAHSLTYSADGGVITAVCSGTDCPLEKKSASLTVRAPGKKIWDDLGKAEAVLDGTEAFNALTGMDVSSADIRYIGTDTTDYSGNLAPADVGTYAAVITLTGVNTSGGENQSVAASVNFTIGPRPVTVAGAIAKERDYVRNGKSVEITAVTFEGENRTELLPGTDYLVTGEMKDDTAGDSKDVTVTVTLLNPRYSLAENTAAATVKINRISYTGTKTAYGTVWSNQDTASAALALPALPAGAVYAAAGTVSDTAPSTPALISGTPSVSGTTLTYAATSQPKGTSAVITIPVTGATNYDDYDVVVTITAEDKADAGAAITGGDRAVTYGDTGVVLAGTVANAGENGAWKWSSGDESIAEIDSTTGAVTVRKAGYVTITAGYESDGTIGTAVMTLTVNPASVPIPAAASGLKWTGREQTGVPDGAGYTVSDGKKTDAGAYTATVTLIDKTNCRWSDSTTEDKKIEWSIARAAPVVAAPTARTGLKYNGQQQELVNPGGVTGGTMQYAIGTDGTTAPVSGWSTAVPTAADAGTWYVWYKAVGNGNCADSAPACVTVTIAQPPASAPAEKKPSQRSLLRFGFRVYNQGEGLTVRWGKADKADSYEVYAQYCGVKKIRKIRTLTGREYTIKKLNGKKLDPTRCVRVYVAAMKGGREIARTQIGHAAGRKSRYTNVEKIIVPRPTIILKAGKTKKLRVSVRLEDEDKKEISAKAHHCSRFTCTSSNSGVATVGSSGKIRAVAPGTCEIRIYAMSGVSSKVKVVVV